MKKIIKQSVATKVLSTVSLALLFLVLITNFLVAKSNAKLDNARDDRYALVQNANRFWDASNYLTEQARTYAVTGDKVYYDNYWNEVNTAKNREVAYENMYEIGLTEEEKSLIDKISKISNDLVPFEDQAMKLAQQGKTGESVAILYGTEYSAGVLEIDNVTTTFFNKLEARTSDELKRITTGIIAITIINYFCLAIVVMIQILLIWYILKKLIKPIIQVQDNMVLLAQGNLSEKLDLEEDASEIGTLAGSMHKSKDFLKAIIDDVNYVLGEMAGGNFDVATRCEEKYVGEYRGIILAMRNIRHTLNNTLVQINHASDQVASGSDQVSSGAQALSQGATEQASAIEELSAAIIELSRQVKVNADDAAEASSLSNEAGFGVMESNECMEEMITAMSDISNKSSEIGKIIKTIDDIAFQTNILALNAAVEAARAGSAGKGFSVVADEVRNLAQKSAEAAKNTTLLIEGSISAVENGTSIASQTAQSLQEVVEKATIVTGKIQGIAHASEEQATAIAQITQGIEQVSAVVQTNSATAEESAAASEELSGQSLMLKDLVSKFKLHQVDMQFENTSKISSGMQYDNTNIDFGGDTKY